SLCRAADGGRPNFSRSGIACLSGRQANGKTSSFARRTMNNISRSSIMTSNTQPVVEIIGLNKWFGTLHVLRDIDFDIPSGGRIVVCGPSGSGKSTLIRCVNGLETYQSGQLRLAGTLLGEDARA